MHSPELMLPQLNLALHRLRAACGDLGEEEIDKALLPLMQRLLLAEVMGDAWVIAVGGSQGAGKTTLMCSLYDLPTGEGGWLQGNEGRGEKMPVLVVEDAGVTEPQGFVKRPATNGLAVEDQEVKTVAEFHKAIYDPAPKDLLPVLKVPRRHFKRANQAWLLLPGYEKEDRSNRTWQALMRQAMVAAGGCIVVTDETRMANQQQQQIVTDMLENELRKCIPYVVISKTEGSRNDPERQAGLRASAQAVFKIPEELSKSHIILTGTDDPAYVGKWMPKLKLAIDDLNFTGHSNRGLQLGQLGKLVGPELNRVLTIIRSKALLYYKRGDNGSANGADVRDEVLEAFEDASIKLKEAHQDQVQRILAQVHGRAAHKVDAALVRDHEGFKNWISNAFDSTTATRKKMERLVQDAWQSEAHELRQAYANALASLTGSALGRLDPADQKRHTRISGVRKLEQLGYVDESGHPVAFSKIEAEMTADIKMLLRGRSTPGAATDHDASKSLKRSAALLPALSLEYSRIFYTLPELAGLKADLTPTEGSAASNAVARGVEHLGAGVELGKTAIRSLAGVLAVDVLSDGDSDMLKILRGSSEAGQEPASESAPGAPMPLPVVAHPAAMAAVAVVACGYMTVQAISRLKTYEKNASAQAHEMLSRIYDEHVGHLRAHFDKVMSTAKERISESLASRYRMDEKLMRKDRLARAIADATSIASDLRYELEISGGLQLFNADHVDFAEHAA